MEHAGDHHVIDIGALAGEQAAIFLALDALANETGAGDGSGIVHLASPSAAASRSTTRKMPW